MGMCRLLFEYADALEAAFAEHVPAVASALIPAVTFRFNEEVRSSAALALGKVNWRLPRGYFYLRLPVLISLSRGESTPVMCPMLLPPLFHVRFT